MLPGFFVASIVEGHGEVSALPILLRRIHAESDAASSPLILNPPLRVKAGSFLNDAAYRDRYLQLAAAKARYSGRKPLVLVFLDCEDGCPASQGPQLHQFAGAHCIGLHSLICLAYREFETWLVAAAPSLGGVRGFPHGVATPDNPESKRDAKGWISLRLGRSYNEPSDQPAFTSSFEFGLAESVGSFARMRRKLAAFFKDQ